MSEIGDRDIDAIVMEAAVVNKIAGEECDLATAGRNFGNFWYAVKINGTAPSEFRVAINKGLTDIFMENDLTDLFDAYF